MKFTTIITAATVLFFAAGCVQKTKKQTVVYTLDVSKMKAVKKVGLRGWDAPLSWNKDYAMKEIIKDSLYEITIDSYTGRICNEFKFSVNEEVEDGENRKIYFDTAKDTTTVSFTFDKK